MSSSGPDSQNELFEHDSNPSSFSNICELPDEIQPAARRLTFTPTYLIVGVYRLLSDANLRKPAWDKCRHGTQRGLIVGSVWAVATYWIQKGFVVFFLRNSPKIIGLSNDTLFGYPLPMSVHTYYTLHLVLSQMTYILWFFLRRNIEVARSRAYAQTVASRGKGAEFFGPYVEEMEHPPVVDPQKRSITEKIAKSGWIGRWFINNVILVPLALYPVVGICISAFLKSVSVSRSLHKEYFESKKMTPLQQGIWIEERKVDYRVFGFFAALLEGLPLVGPLFSVSNRAGAAMWAFDLEKRQHFIASKRS